MQFGTLIIKGMGFSNFISSVLQMPFGVAETIALLSTGYVTRHWPNMRCFCQFAAILPSAIGAAFLYYLPVENTRGRLTGFCITGFSNAGLPLQFSIVGSNIAGHTKRSVSNAAMFLGYATGFIVGPQFFLQSESATYPTGFMTMIITFAISCLSPLGLYVYLTQRNRMKECKPRESGAENVYARNEEFLDLTDREQGHFRYSK